MKNEGNGLGDAGELRRRAEEIALEKAGEQRAPSTEEIQGMLHELRVHQIELEMQNDELRRTQLALDTSKARYFDLYELAPVGYCTVSEQGLILEANLTAATLLGTSRGGRVPWPFTQFIQKEDQDIYYLHRKNLFETGAPQACELRMAKRDGTVFWAHLEATAGKDADGTRVCRVVMSDITALKKAEEAREKLADAKALFTATVSHELRSPLAAIKAGTDLIADGLVGPVSEEQKDILSTMQKNIDRLVRLINNVLFYEKVEAGKMEYVRVEEDVSEVIREVHQSALLFAGKRRTDLILELGKDLPKVKFDKDKIFQVLINLIANAVKYSEKGSIVTQAWREGQGIHVCVRDSGPGIKAESLVGIFDPFSQTGSARQGGTGLGLAIAREIVLAHHGKIWAESELGKGSAFHFTLPV